MRRLRTMAQSRLPGFLLATWFLGTIADKWRPNDFPQSLQDYEIVHPRVIPNDQTRHRRSPRETFRDSAGNLDDPIYLEIGNWTLRTVANDRLALSSSFTVQWVGSMKGSAETVTKTAPCDHRQGGLEDSPGSSVVLTICGDQVYAMMTTDEGSFFVEPLRDGRHVMYPSERVKPWYNRERRHSASPRRESPEGQFGKEVDEVAERSKRGRRNSVDAAVQEFYNLSGDVFDVEYPEVDELILHQERDESATEYNETIVEELSIDVDDGETGYFSGPSWQRNKMPRKKTAKESPPKWLELGVAADYSVIDFHGLRVQQYILALLNIVSAIYMDPSLESNMILVIVRIILYAEKRDGVVRRGDARRSLENVNKWNRKMLSSGDVNHDAAVWLTRLDIGGPSGYAPVSGVCNPARSCALNRDEGLTSAFIIAHEVAHILGLTHDGDEATGNACKQERSRGSLMAPMVAATFHHFYWSACSKKEFHRRARRWSCLSNKPRYDSSGELRANHFRDTFTMDEQCRMEFGEGYEHCKTFNVVEPCSRLWCGNSNISQTCKTKKGPPLEGTLCGISKWCIKGRCQAASRRNVDFGVTFNKPRDGGWSAWSGWEKCSRTCGIGVRCRTRKCNRPLPAYGGKYCSGPSDDCRLCDLPNCPTFVDLRAQQCSKLANALYHEQLQMKIDLTWLPYVSDKESLKCRLICRGQETGEVFYTRKHVIDGTPCFYGSTDICIQGECHRMGCDHVLGSRKMMDACGVCDGDNSSCEGITSKFQRKLRREVTRVAVVPRGAHNLSLNVTVMASEYFHTDNLTIVIGDGRRRRNVEENLAWSKRDLAIVHGAAFRVSQLGNKTYSVVAYGTAFDDVVILFVVPEFIIKKGITTALTLRYFQNREEKSEKNRYAWLFGGWSFCSATCGGGTRQKMIVCKDEKTGKLVSKRKCPLATKPGQEIESCNSFSCSFKWLPGPWETCSSSCGRFGTQSRQLYCVNSGFNGTEVNKYNEQEVHRAMVQPSICQASPAPINTRECNRIPCPGRWIFTDWSSCTKSNGKGVIQSRIARCIPPENEPFYVCDDPTVKTEIRACTGHVTKAIEFSAACWRDKNRFCSMPGLKRYCGMPGFRRRCCKSCKGHDTLDSSMEFHGKT